jgi:hypothetical protein
MGKMGTLPPEQESKRTEETRQDHRFHCRFSSLSSGSANLLVLIDAQLDVFVTRQAAHGKGVRAAVE